MSDNMFLIWRRAHGRPTAALVYGDGAVPLLGSYDRAALLGSPILIPLEQRGLLLHQLAELYPPPDDPTPDPAPEVERHWLARLICTAPLPDGWRLRIQVGGMSLLKPNGCLLDTRVEDDVRAFDRAMGAALVELAEARASGAHSVEPSV